MIIRRHPRPQQSNYGGEGDYSGALDGLQAAGADPVNDPTGRGLMQRGMDTFNQGQQAQRELTGFSGGVSPDPGIEGFLQAMKERGVNKVAGGSSPAGSAQLTGTGVQ